MSQERQMNLGTAMFANNHEGYMPVRSEHSGMWWGGAGWEPWLPEASRMFAAYDLKSADWIVSSLWPVNTFNDKGQSYVTNKRLILCPSRSDHYETSNPGDMLVGNSNWQNWWSTYHAIGISGFLWHAGWYGSRCPLYLIRPEKHASGQALYTDFVRSPELYGQEWYQLHQNNHWYNGQAVGGNASFADGSARWLPYSTQEWGGTEGCGRSPTGSWAVWGALWGGSPGCNAYFFSGGAARRGKLYMPP